MAQASEGKRKTKNKAKVASPKRAQAGNQLLRESPIPDHVSKREPTNTPRTPSLAPSDRDSPAAGPSDRADLTRYKDDQPSHNGIEPEAREAQQVSTPAPQEATGETQGADVHRRIAERAFLFYAEDGFQHGHDLDHWLEAEREIIES